VNKFTDSTTTQAPRITKSPIRPPPIDLRDVPLPRGVRVAIRLFLAGVAAQVSPILGLSYLLFASPLSIAIAIRISPNSSKRSRNSGLIFARRTLCHHHILIADPASFREVCKFASLSAGRCQGKERRPCVSSGAAARVAAGSAETHHRTRLGADT
jgi:hypothetical protein